MRIRLARASDKDFVLGLAPRLVDFGPVAGRERSEMVARDKAVLEDALERAAPQSAVFIAERDDGTAVGFIHLTTATDYYTDSLTAHVADIVVAPDASGAGVGTLMMRHAEQWAKAEGFALVTLNVFTANGRAREFYRRLGYAEEWIRCIKRL